jgi:hypothetical protein
VSESSVNLLSILEWNPAENQLCQEEYLLQVGVSMDQLGLLIAASVLVGLGALFGIVFWLTNVAR